MKKYLKITILIVSSLFLCKASAQYASLTRYVPSSRNKAKKIEYTDWSTLLRNNISVLGTIDYTGFNKEKNHFDRFIKKLSSTKITNNWKQDERKAYWLNTYNAFSIKLITSNFPIKSITDINKPYKQQFFEINNKMKSLNDVEKTLKTFNDPRLLLVLNRNSISGIRLTKRAYVAEKLDEMLDKRIRLFINKKNKITKSQANLSILFKKYEKEIVKKYGSLNVFINKYSDVHLKKQKITYMNFEEKINSYQVYGK